VARVFEDLVLDVQAYGQELLDVVLYLHAVGYSVTDLPLVLEAVSSTVLLDFGMSLQVDSGTLLEDFSMSLIAIAPPPVYKLTVAQRLSSVTSTVN